MKGLKVLVVFMIAAFFCLVSVTAKEGLTEGIFDTRPDDEDIAEGYGAYEISEGEEEGKWMVVKNSEIDYEIEFNDSLKEMMNSRENLMEAINFELEAFDKDIKNCENNAQCHRSDDEIAYFKGLKKVLEEFKKECEKHEYAGGGAYYVKLVTPDGYKLYSVISHDINVSLELPEDMPEVAEGYTRKYYVVINDRRYSYEDNRRYHKTVVIDDVTVNDDGILEFSYDGFDVIYVIEYEDVEIPKEETVEETPKVEVKPADTFDGITTYAGITIASLALVLGAALYLKKKYN